MDNNPIEPIQYNISNLVYTMTGIEVPEELDAQLVDLANEYAATKDQLLFDGILATIVASAFIACDRDIAATRTSLREADHD